MPFIFRNHLATALSNRWAMQQMDMKTTDIYMYTNIREISLKKLMIKLTVEVGVDDSDLDSLQPGRRPGTDADPRDMSGDNCCPHRLLHFFAFTPS